MLKVLLYALFSPVILFAVVAGFIVWEIFSNGRWKERQPKANPAIPLQNQVIEARRELRDLEYKSRRQKEELEAKILDLQKNKKR